MADAGTDHSVMRCPVCFSRDIDVLMEHDDTLHYCVKCGYRGLESEVRGMYMDIRKKFHGMLNRRPLHDQRKI